MLISKANKILTTDPKWVLKLDLETSDTKFYTKFKSPNLFYPIDHLISTRSDDKNPGLSMLSAYSAQTPNFEHRFELANEFGMN